MNGRVPAALAALALLALVLVACGSDDPAAPTQDGTDPDPDPTAPDSVDIVLRTGMWEVPAGGLVPDTQPHLDAHFQVETADSTYHGEHYLGTTDEIPETELRVPAGVMARITVRTADPGGATVHKGVVHRNLPATDDTLLVDVHLADDTTTPAMGGSLDVTVLGASELALDWTAATDAGRSENDIAYLVWATIAGTKADPLPWAAVPAGQTSCAIGGLEPGRRYDVSVTAVDPLGNVSATGAAATAVLTAPGSCWYVDVDTGVDATGRGTYAEPFKTITHALAASSGGETIYVDRGTYSAATGETFPLVLKDGAHLAGDLDWATGRPLVTLEVGTTEAAIDVPASGFVSGFVIDNAAGGMARGISCPTGYLWVSNVRIEGANGLGGIFSGGRARIADSTFRGFTYGTGVSLYGTEYQVVTSCLVEDCQSGISHGGRGALIHLCLVRDCVNGISVGAANPADAGDVQVSRCFVRDCSDGFDLQYARDTKLLYNTVWMCSQTGIHLMETDETVQVQGCHIDGNPTGVYVRRGNPVIHQSTLVCNRVNLFAQGTGMVDATNCRWDSNPPSVYELEDEYDSCPDGDICYDGNYSGTPLPLHSPTLGTTGCLTLGHVPLTPKSLPDYLRRITPDGPLARISR